MRGVAIGEVLRTLKGDFPDVSVSKIRFLEGEGLIRPERTPAGYRTFREPDLDRLRFILTLQRDSYLPLKVIRERLAAADATGVRPTAETAAAIIAEAPVQQEAPEGSQATGVPAEDELLDGGPPIRLTESDLADQSGLEVGQVRSLHEFGVICEHAQNGSTFFDGDDLAVARIARDFLKLGMEARHLRLFRRSAEQESAMIEQLVVPSMRTRRPEARQQAIDTASELARLSRKLRHAYLRQNLRHVIDGS